MKSNKEKKTSEGLKNVTQFLMSLVGAPKNPTKYKTNSIKEEYKIRYVVSQNIYLEERCILTVSKYTDCAIVT